MTGIVPNDLVHSPTTKYKDEPVDNPLRQQHDISGHQGPQHLNLQHPGPASLAQKLKHPESPHPPSTNIPPGSYGPHALGNGVLHPQHTYGSQEQTYFTSHQPYTTASAPGQYPSSGSQEIMATTQMHRYPPIYHTPQSSSPASVASQTHEHNRSLYTQSPQMTSTLYGYQQALSALPVQPSPYGAHPSPQHHPLTTQSLMMPHQTSTSQLPHQSTQPPAAALASPTTATVQQATPPSRPLLNPPHSATGVPLPPSNANHQSPNIGATSSAAPGPIPATTPLVVRQDSNGVQWIAFEYSRDRVKMEYTIRCDVESVNVDNLSPKFKTENCVYPRACCSKDQYRGNRLVYETECNAVGWALAELNHALRGKRGLIQRAVDSWRNSNQDPRLRSRRVRRMAKINRRQGISAPPPPPHMASTAVAPGSSSSGLTPVGPRPSLGPLATMGPPQLHHHHAQPDGPGHEDVSGPVEFGGTHRPLPPAPTPSGHSPTDVRTAQVFHGYPAFPLPASSSSHRGPSIPPIIRDSGISSFGRHSAVATAASTSTSNRIEELADDDEDEQYPAKEELFGTLPEGKRRKFILVDDTQRGCPRRVKVMLDQVDMDEIPDSYRLSNSVYPRTYFPVQMKSLRNQLPRNRYIKDDTDNGGDEATIGRTMVPAPNFDDNSEVAVPRISARRHRKEVLLNDLGYRMSWSQSRVFAGRTLFLQRSLDAYRNKLRSTMLAAGQEPGSIPAHFETRAGKRRFLERRRRTGVASFREAGHAGSASQHDADDVEP
ncbi:ribosomal protein L24E [Aspergillus unguis]